MAVSYDALFQETYLHLRLSHMRSFVSYSLHRRLSHRKNCFIEPAGKVVSYEELFHETSRVISHEENLNKNNNFGVKDQKWLDASAPKAILCARLSNLQKLMLKGVSYEDLSQDARKACLI